MIDISVIIPCYNAAGYIERCLEALEAQTFRKFEVILVDDCSTDGTSEVVDQLIKKYSYSIKIIKNGNNLGPSLARRNGIMEAKAEYIAFCDSDDYYDADYLSEMYAATEEKKNDVVFCNCYSVYSNGDRIKHNVVSHIRNEDKRSVIATAPHSLCCMLIRRSLFRSIEFPMIRNGEDMAITPVICSNAAGFGFVDKCIYNYVCRENSLSRKFTPEKIGSLKKSFEYIEENLSEQYFEELEYLGIRNYLYSAAFNLFKSETMPDRKQVNTDLSFFTRKYPGWSRNKYYNYLPLHQKIYLFAIKYRLFFVCRILSLIHKKISR